MISTITNRGHLTFMVFEESFRNPVLLRFLQRLIRQARQKLFVILDRHPVHQAKAMERWVQQHASQIRMFPLPTASPANLGPCRSAVAVQLSRVHCSAARRGTGRHALCHALEQAG